MRKSLRTIDVTCALDIAWTADALHAHAAPDDVELRPGDVLTLRDAPATILFGDRLSRDCPATIRRAGALLRAWTRATSLFALTDLYEVGFDTKEPA